ncbi:MAG: chloride channel protein [Rickettsiales bacterium]|nr:chloride channel protein [Rickettsiales bacterium]
MIQIFLRKNIAIFLAFLFITIVTTIFIKEYCETFDVLGVIAKDRLENQPLLIFIVTPLLFWASAFMCRKYASYAAGNSIEHFEESLEIAKKYPDNFSKLSNLLGVKLIIVKAIGSLLCTFGGGALGREGPSVHMSAGIFALLAEKIKRFLPKIDFTTWIISGSAVGMAVAFHAPIAGFAFAVEKMIKMKITNFKSKMYLALFAILVVIAVLYPYHSIFMTNEVRFGLTEIYISIIVAIICGIIAFFFSKTNNYFYQKFTSIKSKWWHLVPILGGAVVATISFYCGIYSFGGGIYTIDAAINAEVFLSYKEVFGRILNTIISFISGCAGGLIAPAVAIGAGIGSLISSFFTNVDFSIFLLVGITAFLTAILREPLTAVMIVFETVNQSIENIIPLLFVAMIALWTVKNVELVTQSRHGRTTSS